MLDFGADGHQREVLAEPGYKVREEGVEKMLSSGCVKRKR